MTDPRIITPSDVEVRSATPDPLHLCVFATVALLGWLFGPLAAASFAGLGLAGYVRAYRGGIKRSRCFLRDTRLVIAYLAVLLVAPVTAVLLSVGP